MLKVLPPRDLTALFVEGNYLAGGEMEATLLLLSKPKIVGWLSIFRVYWRRSTPGSRAEWIFWSIIVIAGVLANCILSPGNVLGACLFFAILANALNTVAKCLQQTEEKYNHTIKYCLTVLNSATKATWSESEVRQIVGDNTVKNLCEFQKAVQQHPKVIAARREVAFIGQL